MNLGDRFIDPYDRTLELEIVWDGTQPLIPARAIDGRKQLGWYAFESVTRPGRDEKKGAPAHRGPQWRDDEEVA